MFLCCNIDCTCSGLSAGDVLYWIIFHCICVYVHIHITTLAKICAVLRCRKKSMTIIKLLEILCMLFKLQRYIKIRLYFKVLVAYMLLDKYCSRFFLTLRKRPCQLQFHTVFTEQCWGSRTKYVKGKFSFAFNESKDWASV